MQKELGPLPNADKKSRAEISDPEEVRINSKVY
jgi:hypothetical protein